MTFDSLRNNEDASMISTLELCGLGEEGWPDCKRSCMESFLSWHISSIRSTEKQADTPYNFF